jgi:ferric-dicitrate binding protein FerR (iron transport regulator)
MSHDLTAHALAPGGNRAILTLSDGTTITLDSARDGMLGKQGNTRIVKLSGGHLAYQAVAAGKVPEKEDASPRYNYNIITTPRGGEYQVVLPDSSVVWLNSASSLRFPVRFAGDCRKVILTGEAYFEISKNAKAPFIVEVDGMRVDVLGTSFDVMAYPDEDAIRTAVAEGSVRTSMGKDAPLVYPNQQASFPRNGGTASVGSADMEEVLAWKEGKFRFRRTDIRTIMRQIARWYNVEIDYKGDLAGVRLYGTMSRKESAAELFELLEQTGLVRFSTEGGRVVVMPATP